MDGVVVWFWELRGAVRTPETGEIVIEPRSAGSVKSKTFEQAGQYPLCAERLTDSSWLQQSKKKKKKTKAEENMPRKLMRARWWLACRV